MRNRLRLLIYGCVCALIPCLSGCMSSSGLAADRIRVDTYAGGDNQCGMYGEPLAKPLRVMVESAVQPGLLGGEGERHPVRDTAVTFQILDESSGAVFVDSNTSTLKTTTDAGGIAQALVRLGDKPGDVRISAAVDTAAGPKTVEMRAVAGVESSNTDLEGYTGQVLEDVGIVLYDAPGHPASGVTVYFHVEGNNSSSFVKPAMAVTDESGRAKTTWTLGSDSQQYFLNAEIQDNRLNIPAERQFHARQISIEAMAINKMNMAVILIGGLALFIYGMKLMSNGLQRMADRRLKKILNAVTRNRWLAVGVGTLVTSIIQSSSATTVMVVGFVNAGLLTLAQAIGVVYGANIGTTVTAQIIAFNLDQMAYPAIAVGLILACLAKRPAWQAFGEGMLGFGLLFLGMTTMSDVLKPMRYSPEFSSWFQTFDCSPIGGVIPWRAALMSIVIGTATTMVVQSSSATVGLVMALSGQGLLSFYTAFALVLGDNIGTTITAQLAALGANRNSKRAAMAHTLFNTVGATYMYILLFLPLWNGQPVFLGFIDYITPGEVFAAVPENITRHIANAHSMFNVFNCILFTPFIGLMVKLCSRIIPMKDAPQETLFRYLEPHLLHTPSLALAQAVNEVSYMVRRAQKSIEEACELFHGGSVELEPRILEREKNIDRLQKEITSYLVGISRESLTPEEAALIPKLIHAVNDAERIGDHSEDIVKLSHIMRENEYAFTPTAKEDMRQLETLVAEQFEASINVLNGGNMEEAKRAKRNEAAITELMARISENHVARLESGECDAQTGVIFLDYVAHLERIGDHLINVAKRAKKVLQVTES